MKLKSIRVINYRSIEDVTFNIEEVDDNSFTYGLIGVNEAGKTSLLKAMALKEEGASVVAKDFKDKNNDICITYIMEVDDEEELEFYVEHLSTPGVKEGVEEAPKKEDVKNIGFTKRFSYSGFSAAYELGYILLENEFQRTVSTHKDIFNKLPRSIFWTAKKEYLIADAINLKTFAQNPESSIPLKNCFLLAGIEDVAVSIKSIEEDSTEKEALVNQLGEAVTSHIKSIWPEHPITVTFYIDSHLLNFHIKDRKSKAKAKTVDQRSDGFKQFISFLLTISAEDRNSLLENHLLLLDEPETHLHPKAQIDFLNELKEITTNERNNVAIFATHSNYMIDKSKFSRNYKVVKETDTTSIELIDAENSSYASVNYEVFGIPTSDYHNELYGKLHQRFIVEDEQDKDREYIKRFDTEILEKKHKNKKNKPLYDKQNAVTLPTFVRNAIHHPEGLNEYSQADLEASIVILRDILNSTETK